LCGARRVDGTDERRYTQAPLEETLMNDCLFCRIAEGLIPTHKIHEDADTVAFFDLNPQAPTHALVIPRKHIQSFTALSPQDGNILAAMAQTVNQVVFVQGL
jgi:histidine triad (HIT) family protein